MSDAPPEPLAIDGGRPVRSDPWPEDPAAEPAEAAEAAAALEGALAGLLGLPASGVVACDSPRRAFALAYRAVLGEEREGAEVVVPALLGEEPAGAALEAGLRPVPAEVDGETATLSPRGLARALSERTRLAVAVHAFGHPAAMAELERFAATRGVTLVEDATGAVGASEHGRPAGTMGAAAVIGFAGSSLLRTAGGAVVVSADAERAVLLRALRDEAGAGIAETDARVALGALDRFEERLGARRRVAWEITLALRRRRAITGMAHGRWVRHGYDRYVLRLRGLLWRRGLEETVAALRAEGIPCEPACGGPLYLDEGVREALGGEEVRLAPEAFAIAERLPGEMIAVPLSGAMRQREVDDLVAAVEKVERAST